LQRLDLVYFIAEVINLQIPGVTFPGKRAFWTWGPWAGGSEEKPNPLPLFGKKQVKTSISSKVPKG